MQWVKLLPPYGPTVGVRRRFPVPMPGLARLSWEATAVRGRARARSVPRKPPPLFRRSKPAETSSTQTTLKEGGKGRPTPTRREAQAAAKARAKGPQDRKAAARLDRQRRGGRKAPGRGGGKNRGGPHLPGPRKGAGSRVGRARVGRPRC